MNKQCQKCGQELQFKKGFSQAKQKSWSGWFCPDKKCGYVEWEKTQPITQPPRQPDWDKLREQREESMSFLNARNNAAILLGAAIQAREITFDAALMRYSEVVQTIYDTGNEKTQDN